MVQSLFAWQMAGAGLSLDEILEIWTKLSQENGQSIDLRKQKGLRPGCLDMGASRVKAPKEDARQEKGVGRGAGKAFGRSAKAPGNPKKKGALG